MFKDTQFICDLFKALNYSGISWAIMRGEDTLPSYIDNDLDILVDPNHLKNIIYAIDKTREKHHAKYIKFDKKYNFFTISIITRSGEILPIDIFTQSIFRLWEISDSFWALNNRKKHHSGGWVTPAGFSASTILFKELIRYRRIQSKHRSRVLSYYRKDSSGFKKSLRNILPSNLLAIVDDFLVTGDFDGLEKIADTLARHIQRPRLRVLIDFYYFILSLCNSLSLRSNSFMAVIIGPDGAGKTSIANCLCDQFTNNVFKESKHLTTNFNIIPSIRSVVTVLLRVVCVNVPKRKISVPGTKHSGMVVPTPKWRQVIYSIWYGIDTCLGHFVMLLHRRSNKLFIFARYYYDFFYQRGALNTPQFILKIFYYLIPKGDVVFYINRSAEDINLHKPELTIREIERQQIKIHQLNQKFNNFFEIDGFKGLEVSVQQCRSYILNRLHRKIHYDIINTLKIN